MKDDRIAQGVLLVDKEEGVSSFECVRRVRKILGVKKVGHAGTLDPFATGLLVLLLGQGTKLSPFLMAGRKRYLATLRLGCETDTLDLTGKIVRERPVESLCLEEVRKKASAFVGDVEQVPPSYSAVKHKGVRAYKMARRGVPLELKKRKVTIHRLEIHSLDLPEMTLSVDCSCGTYVRSLAADLGEALGAGAHLRSLRRLSSGPFTLDGAVRVGDLGPDAADAALRERIIPLTDALPDLSECVVDEETARRIRDGYQPGIEDLVGGIGAVDGTVKLIKGKELVALGDVTESSVGMKKRVRILRVFH